jgi:hypothetical protein
MGTLPPNPQDIYDQKKHALSNFECCEADECKDQ